MNKYLTLVEESLSKGMITNDRRLKIEIYGNILSAIRDDNLNTNLLKQKKEESQTRLTHLQPHAKLSYDSLKNHMYDMKSKGLITIVTKDNKDNKPFKIFLLSITTKGYWFLKEFPNFALHKELLEDSLSESNTKSYSSTEKDLMTVLELLELSPNKSEEQIDSKQLTNIHEAIIEELEIQLLTP